MSWLSGLDPEDFLLRVATPEYPTDDSCDMGQWYDNPWDVQKYATCRLDYTDDGTEEENNG